MVPFNAFAQTRYGGLIYNKNDETIGRSVELYGEYCERAVVVFDQILEAGQIVLDVGANIGMYTLFFAQKVGPEGRVLALEPQRLLYQALCGNMAMNSITNTHCWNMAAGAEPGETTVPAVDYTTKGDFAAVVLGDRADGESVAVVTIDSLGLPRCEVIRVAACGMQEQVLRGATETIARLKPLLYVECDASGQHASLLQYLDTLGYSLHWHEPELFNSRNYAGNGENVFGPAKQKNLFCVDKAVEQQLAGFTPVDIPHAA